MYIVYGCFHATMAGLSICDGASMAHSLKYLLSNSNGKVCNLMFSSVQSLSRVRLFVTPWTAAGQASLSITISQSLLKLMSIKLVMPSNHLILCHPVLLLPSIFPSIRVSSSHQVAKLLELQLQHQTL